MSEQDMDLEKLESAAALAFLCQKVGCDEMQAADLIALYCSRGLVDSWCGRLIKIAEDQSRTGLDNVAVPDWFWDQSYGRLETSIDWENGRASCLSLGESEVFKVRIEGIQFCSHGIASVAVVGIPEKPVSPIVDKGSVTPGPKRNQEKWIDWIAELVAYMHEDGIPDGDYASGQDEVIAAVDSRLAKRGKGTLSRSTVQPTVREVLIRIREI
ncbi:MAG: hypothetical protein ABJP34_00885 [Erythrobacter sp.]